MIRSLIRQIPGAKRMYLFALYVLSVWRNRRQMKMLFSLAAHEQRFVGEVEAIRRKALFDILTYVQAHTAYYRKILPEKITLEQVDEIMERLPVLTRKDIMEHGDELTSDEFEELPKVRLSTSGTTGIPLKFYRCGDYEFSHQNFLYKYITKGECSSLNYEKIVTFGGCYIEDEVRQKKIFWKAEEDNPVYGSCLFSCFYLTEENLSFYIDELERIRPHFIRSYPSALSLFIELCKKAGRHIDIELRGIYVTSENVNREKMNEISQFFRSPVHGQYGHSEACLFGFTKNCDTTYYCSNLYGYVQVVDERGNRVAAGNTGRVVATSYLNKAMPFIKYDTGDLAVYGGNANGFTVLTQLLGRTQDCVLNEDNEKLYIIVGQLSECFLPAINHVRYWQAVQDEPGKMLLKIVKKDSYTPEDEEEIFRVMKTNKMTTTFEYVDDIPLTKAGKRKYVIQNMPLAVSHG